MLTPEEWLAGLLDAIGAPRQGQKWACPVHARTGEHSVALAVGTRRDGQGAWLHCHAGCALPDLLAALRLARADLQCPPPVPPARHAAVWRLRHAFPAPKAAGTPQQQGMRWEAEHGYGQPAVAWKVRYRHPTSGRKAIEWESLNRHGQRVPGLLGRPQAALPLYLEHEVRMGAAADEVVLLVESESSADALVRAGYYATTWSGGAADPPVRRLADVLGAARVALIPDHDDAGLACAARIRHALPTAVVLLGDPGEDARDLLVRVGPTAFRALVHQAFPARRLETSPS